GRTDAARDHAQARAPPRRRRPCALLHVHDLRNGPRPHAGRALDRGVLPGEPADRGSLERRRRRATARLIARGDAEGVDRCVYLPGGEGGLRREVTGDRDRVISAVKLVVDQQERIALRVWWHERGLPPEDHLDMGRSREGQPDRPIVWPVRRPEGGVVV